MQVRLIDTQDGSHSLHSERYGESYHSKYGAIQESRHVFIEAGLHPLIPVKKEARVLEMGFGTGLNALLSLQEARAHGLQLYYETVEAHPVMVPQAMQLNYPERTGQPDDRPLFRQLHEAPWDETVQITPFFELRKLHGTFDTVKLAADFDLVYYDAFAPAAQPELWETPVLQRAWEALRSGGALVTYCAKGSVKRNLRELGFQVTALPGPPGKREMTRAEKP